MTNNPLSTFRHWTPIYRALRFIQEDHEIIGSTRNESTCIVELQDDFDTTQDKQKKEVTPRRCHDLYSTAG
ncbi:MAG: hypothetical protein JNK90_13185 [Planctomycetaceae bacterium]|nr:hypothetical protein [Planctomycetaceae bacterium]